MQKVADTLQLEPEDNDWPAATITDLSDSLKFKSLLLQLESTGSSDMREDNFFEYRDGKLKWLFGLTFLQDVRRKDQNTLEGIVTGQDEILSRGYDFPFTVNLRDNRVIIDTPNIQVIKWVTTTTEPFTAFKVRGKKLSVPYPIKRGTSLTIDTFFRKSGLVRMLLPDSTPVFIWEDELLGKVETNTAG